MIARILIPVILLIVLPDLYVDVHYLRHRSSYVWWKRLLWWLPSLLMLAYSVAIASTRDFVPDEMVFINVYMMLVGIVVMPKAIFALFSSAGYLLCRLRHRRANWGNILWLPVALFQIYIVCYGFIFGFGKLEVRHLDLYFDDLPKEFDGYRIVLFSDAHVGSFKGSLSRMLARDVDSINAQRPDMIVFTGDLQNLQPDEIRPFMGQLSNLRAKDGVWSVLGNHDYSFYISATDSVKAANERLIRELERACGWHLLENSHHVVRRGQDSIVIAGEGNFGNGIYPERANLWQTLRGVDKRSFVVMLQHSPVAWHKDILPHSNVQLTLSGHTHGGQMSVFGLRPTALHGDPDYGLYREGSRMLYVTGGIGALVPFRFNMPAEIVVITLKQGQ